MEQIRKRCRSIINRWDDHLIISISGLSLEESYCTSSDSATVEGRCKDFTALRIRKSVTLNDCESYASNSEGFRFILVKYLVAPTAASSVTNTVTVQLNQLSDLNTMTDSIFLANIDSYNVKKLLTWLVENNISAIFCSDSVSES